MVKKTYITPQTLIEVAECEMLIAASMFDISSDTQSITPTDDEYNDEFSAKEYSFGDD